MHDIHFETNDLHILTENYDIHENRNIPCAPNHNRLGLEQNIAVWVTLKLLWIMLTTESEPVSTFGSAFSNGSKIRLKWKTRPSLDRRWCRLWTETVRKKLANFIIEREESRLFIFMVRVLGPLKRDTSYTGKTNAPLSLSFDEGDPLKVMDGCAILPERAIVIIFFFFFSLLASWTISPPIEATLPSLNPFSPSSTFSRRERITKKSLFLFYSRGRRGNLGNKLARTKGDRGNKYSSDLTRIGFLKRNG